MNFTDLQKQILTNIDLYNAEETKIVVTKLLDFLIELEEKKRKLEEDNLSLLSQVNDLNAKVAANTAANELKASKEVSEIIQKANDTAENIIKTAQVKHQEIINEANNFMKSSIVKIEKIIDDIKKKDEDAKAYRSHILSIFRKTIFRFSDTNYYLIRTDNKDFRDLCQFFTTDEKLQKLCDEIINNLANDPEYQKILDMVKENPLEALEDIIKDDKITIDNKSITEIKLEAKEMEEVIEESENEEFMELKKPTSKFLDIINRYNKK